MADPQKTPEQQVKEEEARVQQQVDEAGQKAAQDAKNEGLTEEEVNKKVEKARQDEKDKLYPQLEELKNTVKDLQEMLRAQQEEKEQIKAEAEAEKERERQAKLSDSERQTEALRRLEEKLDREREAREKLEQEGRDREEARKLEVYREKAISAAGDEIIPELVKGKSEEEIDRSIEIAKARYAEFAEKWKTAAGASTRTNMPRSTSPDNAALEEQDLDEQLTAYDERKYREDPEYRERIQNELARAYEKAAGRL